jgi:hypothetical protein
MRGAACQVCHEPLSAILSPYESFKKQMWRLQRLLCSTYCQKQYLEGGK